MSSSTASTSAQGIRFLEIRPVPKGLDPWNADNLAASMVPTTLPPGDNEAAEKAALKSRGWKDPRGLKAYSKDGTYVDLYVYFDAADRTSPLNVAATKAFKIYGLDGAQYGKEWEDIRGPCVALRMEPPTYGIFGSGGVSGGGVDPAEFKPLISVDEIVQTLLFFKDKDAKKVALKRDAQRTLRTPGWPAADNDPFTYVGPAGTRKGSKVVGKDADTCATCGVASTIACGLKKCSRCKSVWYCGRDCQVKDYKRHKQDCLERAKEAEA